MKTKEPYQAGDLGRHILEELKKKKARGQLVYRVKTTGKTISIDRAIEIFENLFKQD